MSLTESLPFRHVQIPPGLLLPVGDLTPGKIYKVVGSYNHAYSPSHGHAFTILDDKGRELFCIEKQSSHLLEKDWIIFDYEKNLENILK